MATKGPAHWKERVRSAAAGVKTGSSSQKSQQRRLGDSAADTASCSTNDLAVMSGTPSRVPPQWRMAPLAMGPPAHSSFSSSTVDTATSNLKWPPASPSAQLAACTWPGKVPADTTDPDSASSLMSSHTSDCPSSVATRTLPATLWFVPVVSDTQLCSHTSSSTFRLQQKRLLPALPSGNASWTTKDLARSDSTPSFALPVVSREFSPTL
mmetsp:Transcript_14424/g.45363  ORF Transcript_14424/g.45363 Transcript_14424/m.45363 type:complete len:210 (+) Transcript_14424:674-1303(+)